MTPKSGPTKAFVGLLKKGSACLSTPPCLISCDWRSQGAWGRKSSWQVVQGFRFQRRPPGHPKFPPLFPPLQVRHHPMSYPFPHPRETILTPRSPLSQCQWPGQAPSGCLWAPGALQGTNSGSSGLSTAVWGWRQGWSLVRNAISWAVP